MLLWMVSLASAASGWSGAHVVGEDTRPRRASVSAGLGGSWILGENAAGYAPGLAERVTVDLALGPATAFDVEFDHARHVLDDASAYFPGANAPADALSGFRDYMSVDAGFRLGFDATAQARSPVVRVFPYVRLGLGAAFTNTLLDGPGFAGRVAMRSRTAWPAPSVAAGVEVRVRRWISLVPQMKSQVQVFEDVAESTGGKTSVAAEWRLQPTLDVSINF
jgi:hypothetical protein